MKNILFIISILPVLLVAENNKSELNKHILLKKQIEKEMAKEKKYAIEQKFYKEDEYDFKGAEVNQESLKNIKVIEPDPNAYNSDFIDMPN